MTPGDGEVFINGCELNFGVFRSVWISEILSGCFSLSFGWSLLLWLLMVYDSVGVFVPCLKYPNWGDSQGYINIYIYQHRDLL